MVAAWHVGLSDRVENEYEPCDPCGHLGVDTEETKTDSGSVKVEWNSMLIFALLAT